MAEWGKFKLTKEGREIIAEAHNHTPIRLIGVSLGAGAPEADQDVSGMTSLIEEKQRFAISQIKNNKDGTFTVSARITNNGLNVGYRIKECGIYAEKNSTDESGEIIKTSVLFGVSFADESDYMPAATKATMVDAPVNITIVISSDANVTARIDADAYATIKYSDQKDDEVIEKVKEIIKKIVDTKLQLPIGAIIPYYGKIENIPEGWHLCDGTDGTPNLKGRFLEGTTENPKQWKSPGLPNITGSFYGHDTQSGWNATGAMRPHHNGEWNDEGGTFHKDYKGGVNFNASWSNPIYGRSDTVQPASYTVYYIVKIKNVEITL